MDNTIDALKVAIKARKSPKLDWIAADEILVFLPHDPDGLMPISEGALPPFAHLAQGGTPEFPYEYVAPSATHSCGTFLTLYSAANCHGVQI